MLFSFSPLNVVFKTLKKNIHVYCLFLLEHSRDDVVLYLKVIE